MDPGLVHSGLLVSDRAMDIGLVRSGLLVSDRALGLDLIHRPASRLVLESRRLALGSRGSTNTDRDTRRRVRRNRDGVIHNLLSLLLTSLHGQGLVAEGCANLLSNEAGGMVGDGPAARGAVEADCALALLAPRDVGEPAADGIAHRHTAGLSAGDGVDFLGDGCEGKVQAALEADEYDALLVAALDEDLGVAWGGGFDDTGGFVDTGGFDDTGGFVDTGGFDDTGGFVDTGNGVGTGHLDLWGGTGGGGNGGLGLEGSDRGGSGGLGVGDGGLGHGTGNGTCGRGLQGGDGRGQGRIGQRGGGGAGVVRKEGQLGTRAGRKPGARGQADEGRVLGRELRRGVDWGGRGLHLGLKQHAERIDTLDHRLLWQQPLIPQRRLRVRAVVVDEGGDTLNLGRIRIVLGNGRGLDLDSLGLREVFVLVPLDDAQRIFPRVGRGLGITGKRVESLRHLLDPPGVLGRGKHIVLQLTVQAAHDVFPVGAAGADDALLVGL
ncbi:hypothetical protein G6O67_003037 [Ophiocordyceps sinensis]|uniref:Uncharacterized protein n=1 Tax=Ophiocordyceps sinensis TaxID=72228 RepID=A0A8H4V7W2_9HYPO|nr:hypothetical protein G6O67_003037 [Ophiocordyceps sinensis]